MKWPGKKYTTKQEIQAQGILEDRAEKVAGCMRAIVGAGQDHPC